MRALIIYGSQYGTTKRYAEKFSQMTGIPCTNYEELKDLAGYDKVIHFGGLYAGGGKRLTNNLQALSKRNKHINVNSCLAAVPEK